LYPEDAPTFDEVPPVFEGFNSTGGAADQDAFVDDSSPFDVVLPKAF
jgi:hypothetical protein